MNVQARPDQTNHGQARLGYDRPGQVKPTCVADRVVGVVGISSHRGVRRPIAGSAR